MMKMSFHLEPLEKMNNIDTIKELANLKVHEILSDLGINYTDRYHSLTAPCPIHGSDRIDSWSYHVDRGIWRCFSRDCDKKYDSDIFGLVKGMKSCSFGEAVDYIKKFVDLNISKEKLKAILDARNNREFVIKTKRTNKQNKIYPEECLSTLEYHGYLESRGFSRTTVEEYHVGIGKSTGKYMSNRIVFPVRNINGEIIGFTGRSLFEDWKERGIPKWLHSRDLDVKNNLFNIDRAKRNLVEKESAIIVEGPLDVLRLEDSGIRNSVAIFGKKMYSPQMFILMSLGVVKLYLALDNDAAGQSGTDEIVKLTRNFFNVKVVKLPKNKKDIGELSNSEILEVASGI